MARRYDLVRLESLALPSIRITLSRWHIGGHRSVSSVVRALHNRRIVASVQPNFLFALQDKAGHGTVATKKRRDR